jgi:hypothetical protein
MNETARDEPSSLELEFHEVANAFPLMEGADFDNLVQSIQETNLKHPIVLYEEKILDGRNRYLACKKAGRAVTWADTYEYQGEDPIGEVMALNVERRHLTVSQRAMIAEVLANLKHGRPEKKIKVSSGDLFLPLITREEAAAKLQVSKGSFNRARTVKKHGTPELAQAVKDGSVSLRAAADIVSLPHPEQAEIVKQGPEAVKEKAREMRQTREEKKPPLPPLQEASIDESHTQQEPVVEVIEKPKRKAREILDVNHRKGFERWPIGLYVTNVGNTIYELKQAFESRDWKGIKYCVEAFDEIQKHLPKQ